MRTAAELPGGDTARWLAILSVYFIGDCDEFIRRWILIQIMWFVSVDYFLFFLGLGRKQLEKKW